MSSKAFRIQKGDLDRIFRLAWPAVVQEALSTVVTYIDAAMIGALGANASAAVGLTGTVSWFVSSIPSAFGIGVLSVCAQADGANDGDTIKKAGQQAFFIMLALGILLTAASLAVAPYIAVWLGGDPVILKDATTYFTITSIPMIFKVSLCVLPNALRGVSDMKTPMYINLLMNALNIGIDFFLIFPTREIFGITVPGAGLGVLGTSIGTAAAYLIGGIAMIIRYFGNKRFDFKHTGFHFDREVMKKCLGIGAPSALKRGLICTGHIVFSSMVARLGVIPFAAHTIALQAEQAFYIPGYGFQSAAATIAGNAVGENDENKLNRFTLLISSIAGGLMLAAGVILFLFAPNLMGIFTPDAEVIELGAAVLRIVAVSEPIYGVLVIIEGVFDGMGDTKAPVIYATFTMWGIRILGSFIMIKLFNLGLQAVWLMMIADNIARCILLLARFLRRNKYYKII